jgi:PAS domain S-box-containing protein
VSLFGAALTLLFGLLHTASSREVVDPTWARLTVAGLFAGLFAASYGSRVVRRNYVAWMRGATYVFMVWFVVIASLNGFAGSYGIGLLLVYSVLTAIIGLGAWSIWPVLRFVGIGLLLTSTGGVVGAASYSPLLYLLGSMAVVATAESTALQAHLSMQEKLREQEARLRGLTNSISGVVYQFYACPDGTYGYHFVSERVETLLELEANLDGLYERFLEHIPPSHRNAFARSVDEAVEKETSWRFETPLVTPSGKRIWLLGTATPERRGEEFIANGVVLDITERKQAEQALQDERNRFETLFESLPTPVVRCTVEEGEALIADANRAFEQKFGVDAAAVRGKDLDGLVVPADRREEAAEIDRRALEEGILETEVRRRTPRGQREFRLQIAGRTREGDPPEIYAIYTDITDRKQHEERLREAKREAERLSRLKSALLSNMSHEFRTPLTSVTGFAEMLKNTLEGDKAEFADQIYRSGQRLKKTLDSVLNLSRLEAKDYDLEREPVVLENVIEKTVDQLRPIAREAAVELKTALSDVAVTGRWNEDALRRIAENLIDNAIKFTPEGGRVEVRMWKEEGWAFFEVKDTGIGMDPESVPRIFRAFEQTSTGKGRKYEGSGLGLSIVKRLVDALEGDIDVETEKGSGSRFMVRIPKAGGGGNNTDATEVSSRSSEF